MKIKLHAKVTAKHHLHEPGGAWTQMRPPGRADSGCQIKVNQGYEAIQRTLL